MPIASPTITPTATRTANRYGYAATNPNCYANSYAEGNNQSHAFSNTNLCSQSNTQAAPDAAWAPDLATSVSGLNSR
jgi:hypothetical protein